MVATKSVPSGVVRLSCCRHASLVPCTCAVSSSMCSSAGQREQPWLAETVTAVLAATANALMTCHCIDDMLKGRTADTEYTALIAACGMAMQHKGHQHRQACAAQPLLLRAPLQPAVVQHSEGSLQSAENRLYSPVAGLYQSLRIADIDMLLAPLLLPGCVHRC
jgi:hypothetical protein